MAVHSLAFDYSASYLAIGCGAGKGDGSANSVELYSTGKEWNRLTVSERRSNLLLFSS